MLSTIREIGKWQRDKYSKDELDTLIHEPFRSGGKIFFIKVDIDTNDFVDVELEDYDSSRKMKYIFRKGPSNGPNPTPAAIITEVRKTFENKIQKWFIKYGAEEKNEFLGKIRDILNANKDSIIKSIQKHIKNLNKKDGKLLTIKIKQDNEWKYIGELDIFKESLRRIESQKTGKISVNNKVCSICGMQKVLVSGDVNVFKFYTIDKLGFITGGFDKNLAWKNFPVCPECKLELEEGKKFLDAKLNFKFYGLNYYLIPKLLIGDKVLLEEILNIMSDTLKTINLKERIKKRITNDENEILEYLSEKKDILTLNFLFLRKDQGAERILLMIEDVFPSRIRKIFAIKDQVDKLFNEEFNFGKIRTFFSKSDENKRDSDLNKYFLEIVDSVFKGKQLDFAFLLKFYMAVIRKEFINDGYFTFRVKDALMNTVFFENLGLITFEEVKMEESIFNDIFIRYGKSFANPAKRGIFLLGALTQLLLNKQWAERNAKPFMKKLKGLKMDERDIKALLPEVQNKLEEYDSFDLGKRLIASEASKYLIEAGERWNMSVDEINFYFACGMNLSDSIAGIAYHKFKKEE